MGQPPYPAVKAKGDQSMAVTRRTLEDVYSRYAPQDPHDRMKAGLPEPQFPTGTIVCPQQPRLAGPSLPGAEDDGAILPQVE